ncbi:tRNA dimethylallyltransferase 9 [Andrographis paniculata]|uniref:tRNA dimethylallyltransferase 9 n=1 Tax=Andrographis paniculata TaxID=175694 RepID=UPI0021E9A3B0|nr:tRNA dimethylallyltransferase 9 [Andrographis paniculata]XP_051126890.1 tRNA dimethylallyltransferase 9 [Andrographis paniculata]XP_051126891.1 tRNA dimethylallyltransferase 9 [Andrographis paniculata]
MISSFRVGGLRFHRPQPAPLFRPFSRSIRLFTASCSAALPGERQKVVVISGPTGAGKSRLALELAKRLNGEIVSADSVQVYRGLDVGSAKPSVSERQEVPHHLVDVLHPSEDYSVGQFYEDARKITEEILSRGRVPIVSGGTGLYLRWFIYGKPDVPKASHQITSEVHAELADLQRDGNWYEAVQLVIKAGDPGVHSLAANDWYRLRRRLEILKLTGASPSTFEVPYNSFKEKFESSAVDDSGINSSVAEESRAKDLKYNFICFFLSTQRLDLYRSIDSRCEEMLLGDGLLSEAKWLLDLGLMPNSNSATRAIGYRQAMDYLLLSREQEGWSSPKDFYKFLFEFQKASRNFAKRQLTWFRNEPLYQWIDASNPLENVLSFICDAYEDQTGKLEVPRSLRMEKDMSNLKEVRLLKAYRPKNRHFMSREDCSNILEWVRKNQGVATIGLP